MKILLISKVLLKTGVGNHIKQLYEELMRQGHDVWVVSSNNILGVAENDGRFIQVNLATNNPFRFASILGQLHHFIQTNGIEVVHCHHRKAALVMKLYNLIWKIPVVYTLHSAPVPSDIVHRKLSWGGHRSIAISSEVAMFMFEKLNIAKEQIRLVSNGIDESVLIPLSSEEKEKLLTRYEIPSDKFVIAMHGRISEVKNHLGVAEAICLLPEVIRKNIVVLCSGEQTGRYYNRLVAYIQDNDVKENFRFVGWQSPRNILGVADILLAPSLKEGFGLNCIEAMFMKVPVLRTPMGGYKDMAAFVVKIQDTQASFIAKAIIEVLQNHEHMTTLADKAFAFAKKNCSLKEMTVHTVSVYKELQNVQS